MNYCARCGWCCSHLVFKVDGSEESRLYWLARGIELKKMPRNQGYYVVIEHICPHLEWDYKKGLEHTCLIYSKRPAACKTWPKGIPTKEILPAECGFK